jgi:glycosyltransferase involved in cell wall biosynthesis
MGRVPLVILESYFLGKPVIASNVGGVQDIVSNGEMVI